MGSKIVKNYPSPRLMETIGATNQKPPEAIGELVANCFDARVLDEKMKIVVDMRNEKVLVIDNGRGMTENILEKAVCIAEDMSRHIERGKGAKGHFGMGFKTSCSTLGGYYEIFHSTHRREHGISCLIRYYGL
jgi:DNA gyrase/topoisomerase IV subunit B